jgi:hypothetical protein
MYPGRCTPAFQNLPTLSLDICSDNKHSKFFRNVSTIYDIIYYKTKNFSHCCKNLTSHKACTYILKRTECEGRFGIESSRRLMLRFHKRKFIDNLSDCQLLKKKRRLLGAKVFKWLCRLYMYVLPLYAIFAFLLDETNAFQNVGYVIYSSFLPHS